MTIAPFVPRGPREKAVGPPYSKVLWIGGARWSHYESNSVLPVKLT